MEYVMVPIAIGQELICEIIICKYCRYDQIQFLTSKL